VGSVSRTSSRQAPGTVTDIQHGFIMKQKQQFEEQCQPIILECKRCGELFSEDHVCKAINRKCYCCDKFGHYSKLCLSQKFARSADQQPRNSPASATMKQKSVKKQQRDIRRLLEFRERKTLCANLPFYELTNVVFSRFVRRSQYNSTVNVCSVMCAENPVVSSMRQISSLQEENQILQAKIAELNDTVDQEQKRRQSAENDIAVSLQNATEKRQSELTKKERELDSVSDKNTRLYCTNMNQMTEIESLKEKEDELLSHRKKLYDLVLKLIDLEGTAADKILTIGEEFENVTDQFYGGCWSDAPSRRRPCRNCGSSNNHHPADCLAKGNVCSICNKSNHFTALCKASESLVLEGVDAAEMAFLEEMEAVFDK